MGHRELELLRRKLSEALSIIDELLESEPAKVEAPGSSNVSSKHEEDYVAELSEAPWHPFESGRAEWIRTHKVSLETVRRIETAGSLRVGNYLYHIRRGKGGRMIVRRPMLARSGSQ